MFHLALNSLKNKIIKIETSSFVVIFQAKDPFSNERLAKKELFTEPEARTSENSTANFLLNKVENGLF